MAFFVSVAPKKPSFTKELRCTRNTALKFEGCERER